MVRSRKRRRLTHRELQAKYVRALQRRKDYRRLQQLFKKTCNRDGDRVFVGKAIWAIYSNFCPDCGTRCEDAVGGMTSKCKYCKQSIIGPGWRKGLNYLRGWAAMWRRTRLFSIRWQNAKRRIESGEGQEEEG